MWGGGMKPDGGTAFPRPAVFSPECGTMDGAEGMSLRDWFAGKALEGLTAQPDCRLFDGKADDAVGLATWRVKIAREDAEHCYRLADAMLAEREK